MEPRRKLKLLPRRAYRDVRLTDPLRFYFLPFFRTLYQRRVELCLTECRAGGRVLDVGFGSGVTFPNLDELYDEIYGIDSCARADEVAEAFAELGIETHLRKGNLLDLPYREAFFDTVLLVSVLEHLRPVELPRALREIHRVLKPGGQMVYGVPVERPLMVLAFRVLGYNIREHHFSTEQEIGAEAREHLAEVRMSTMSFPLCGKIYEVRHFLKTPGQAGQTNFSLRMARKTVRARSSPSRKRRISMSP